MGALPQALEIIFEMQRKMRNEKIARRKISFSTYKMLFFPLFGPLLLSRLLTFSCLVQEYKYEEPSSKLFLFLIVLKIYMNFVEKKIQFFLHQCENLQIQHVTWYINKHNIWYIIELPLKLYPSHPRLVPFSFCQPLFVFIHKVYII